MSSVIPEVYWDNQAYLADYYSSRYVPWTANPGVTVASILVSVLGSYATLLILGKRTSNRGFINWLLLALSAGAFTVVAVWSMHFISMLGLRLQPSPTQSWYIQFSAGYTSLSLFMPLIAFMLAFIFCGGQGEFQFWKTALSGVVMGGTIALMHYSASFRMPLYVNTWRAYTVVISILEAAAASTAALSIFFKYRALWQDSFPKRAGCSVLLAAAVCGMHYIALAGTRWKFKEGADWRRIDGGKEQSVKLTIAISVMCLVIILASLGLAVRDFWRARKISTDARQIVLASAAFDKMGRMLVKMDGTLPLVVIETDAVLKDIISELNPHKPTFQWLFSLSFNWQILIPFHSQIAAAIAARRGGKKFSTSSSNPTAFYGRNGSRAAAARANNKKAKELALFRSRFVEAVFELAGETNIRMEDIGVLFDKVLVTGTLGLGGITGSTNDPTRDEKDRDVEQNLQQQAQSAFNNAADNEGLMMVVVRELDPTTLDAYMAHGYRLAEIKHFSHVFSSRIGVPKLDLDTFLASCKTFAKRGTRPVVQPAGAYVGLFGVRAGGEVNEGEKGVEALTYGFAKHQIPAYRLPDVSCPIIPEARNWLRTISGMTISEVLYQCDEEISKPVSPRQRRRSMSSQHSGNKWSDSEDDYDDDEESTPLLDFQIALSIAVEALGQAMVGPWPEINDIARLSPEILTVPSSLDGSTEPAQMIVLEAVLPSIMVDDGGPMFREKPESPDLDNSRRAIRPFSVTDKPPAPFTFTPFPLFSSAQTMLIKGRGAKEFAKEVTDQLGPHYGVKVIGAPEPVAAPPSANPNHPFGSSISAPLLPPPSGALPPPPPGAPVAPPLGISMSVQSSSSQTRLPTSGSRNFSKPLAGVSSQDPLTGYASGSQDHLTHMPAGVATVRAPIRRSDSDVSLSSAGPGGAVKDGVIGGRVAVGGTDGWHLRAMRDLELTPQGQEGLVGLDW